MEFRSECHGIGERQGDLGNGLEITIKLIRLEYFPVMIRSRIAGNTSQRICFRSVVMLVVTMVVENSSKQGMYTPVFFCTCIFPLLNAIAFKEKSWTVGGVTLLT